MIIKQMPQHQAQPQCLCQQQQQIMKQASQLSGCRPTFATR